MKRIVTFVVPLAEADPPGAATSNGDGAEAVPVDDAGFDPAAMPAGSMKVEVIVSDVQANRIIAAVLEHGSGADVAAERGGDVVEFDSPLEMLVRKELEGAEPDADNLLERIVMRVEKQLISQVYSDCDHVKSRAAARLGINRNTLLKKLRQFGAIADEASEAESA